MGAFTEAILFDLGRMAYEKAHALQQQCVAWRLAKTDRPDLFLVVEHPPVFTIGKQGGLQSLMVSEEFLAERKIKVIATERGGDITYHGPGQLVLYPIVNLKKRKLSVTGYVELLEELLIDLARCFGVNAGRDLRNRGAWVKDNKIGSIGIRLRHGITFHGLAFNVNIDFEHFSWIRPCGLQQVGVSSLARETGKEISLALAKKQAIPLIEEKFNCKLRQLQPSQLL